MFTIGKGLGGGYQPVSAVLFNQKVIDVIGTESGFIHAQTFQGSPIATHTGFVVLSIILKDNLVANSAKRGKYIMKHLKANLQDHPYVGDIRGMGLFIGIEFVADKASKAPFDAK